MRYSIDTSSLIAGFRRVLPYDIFPTFWNRDLPSLIDSGDLRATEIVRWELEEDDDEVLHWVDEYAALFVALDVAIQEQVKEILSQHPRMLHAGRSGADPFVIALARMNEATVVCEERPGKETRPKIPDVCESFGVQCIAIVELVREEGFSY